MNAILNDGWLKYNSWENTSHCLELYKKRSLKIEVEMTCARQAAAILATLADEGDSILDVGCGSGYFFHSLKNLGLNVKYYGIDSSEKFIKIGHETMPGFGLPAQNLQHLRIEDFRGEFDHVLSMNTLTYLDNYPRALERMLISAKKSVILRESFKEKSEYLYVVDPFLDTGKSLKVPINHYCKSEVENFIKSYAFSVEFQSDIRSGDKPEMVVGHPHYWMFCVAKKKSK